MEHVSTVLSRTLPTLVGKTDTGQSVDLLAPHRSPRTLADLALRFEQDEALENKDARVAMSDLRSSDGETIEVPGLGTFGFTDWSRRQCGARLGVRMDRWFENASADERADELNRRFRRSTESVSLRTTRLGADEDRDGTLRAFVSPGYTPIRDSVVARMLATALSPTDSQLALVRCDVTDMTTSYVARVGEAFTPGDDHEVGDVWGGVLVRNSNVGYASLIVVLHLTRLVCKNGLTLPVPNPVLVRRRHTSLDDAAIRGLLAEQFERLPERLAQGAELLRQSRQQAVADIDEAIAAFLDSAGLPRRHARALRAAYDAAPHGSAFGIAQAATLAAQGMGAEARFEVERAAGAYIAAAQLANQ